MSDALFRIGELSRRTGVSIDVIRAWERRYGLLNPSRSDSNFRMYTRDDVARLRLMQHYVKQQVAPARAAELVRQAKTASLESNPGIPAADIRKALSVLHESLERFEDAPADQLLRRLVGVFTPGIVFRDVLLPYLRELGARWECGEASIAQEHFASGFLEHWMLGCARRTGRPGSRRAVLACVPGEHHSLGLTAFGVVLRDLGWGVTFLGRDVPVAAARSAADAVRADAIVLAAVMPEPLAAAARDLTELMETHSVVVGGPAADRDAGQLPKPRLLRADLVGAARALTLATP
ncbi:MAG TPA: MerR family transcriptional regulator, partial [Solirubrobacteraceae bacterium]|nr:MerR family transcriptional regulator [Solirubrobacteraceae bacterium]